jgi:hypothetical protein
MEIAGCAQKRIGFTGSAGFSVHDPVNLFHPVKKGNIRMGLVIVVIIVLLPLIHLIARHHTNMQPPRKRRLKCIPSLENNLPAPFSTADVV